MLRSMLLPLLLAVTVWQAPTQELPPIAKGRIAPRIDGNWWTIAHNPDLGALQREGCASAATMSGVGKEFELLAATRPEVPRFCVGLGGGTAAKILLDQETADVAAARAAATGSPAAPTPTAGTRVDVSAHLWYTPATAVDAILRALESE